VPTEVATVASSVPSASPFVTPADTATTPATAVKATNFSTTTAQSWWGDSFEAASAYEKLVKIMVPTLVAQNKLAVLGGDSLLFFTEAMKKSVKHKDYLMMRSGYYIAIAKELFKAKRLKEADYYVKFSLSIDAQNKEALALQMKIDQPKP
jgi:hypothetical protein